MTASVERSTGIPVTVGVMAFVVGGGYSGLTDDLDGAVQAGADALRDLFNHDVTIRFNSDRKSGGSWLKTNENTASFSGNCEIGIGASLFDLAASRKSAQEFNRRYKIANDDPELGFDRHLPHWAELGYDLNGPNQQVLYTGYIKRDYLRNPAEFVPSSERDDVLYTHHRTLADVVDHVRRMATDRPCEITEAMRRAACERRELRKLLCEVSIMPLSKKALLAILRGIDFKYKSEIKWSAEAENKTTLRRCIIDASADNVYTYDAAHHAGIK